MLRVPILLLGLLVALGCTSTRCSVTGDQPLLILTHASAGDGPTAWQMTVYEDGLLQLEKLGRKGRCRRVSRDTQGSFNGFRDAFESWTPSLSKPKGSRLSHHELIQIDERGVRQIFRADEIPESLEPLLQMVDKIFAEEYGSSYNWPLLGPKSGPR